jgi:hypothetical protein
MHTDPLGEVVHLLQQPSESCVEVQRMLHDRLTINNFDRLGAESPAAQTR